MAVEVAPGEVHVWRAGLDGARPASRRERRRAAGLALRWVLAAYLGMHAEDVPFSRGAHGKPELATDADSDIRFNLSHSAGLALIAVTTGHEVGIDVECEVGGRAFARLSRRALTSEQAKAVHLAPDDKRAAAFYTAWVRREAIAKCHGGGLGATGPTQPMTVWNIEVAEGYAAAVAIADAVAATNIRPNHA